MSATVKYPITIQQGASWGRTFIWQVSVGAPKDLTGWSAVMQVREAYGSPVLLTLSTDNGGITLGGITGSVTLLITAAQTQGITKAKGVFDLKMIPPTGPGTLDRRLIEGTVTLSKAVTVL
jgi:hypothetical protein